VRINDSVTGTTANDLALPDIALSKDEITRANTETWRNGGKPSLLNSPAER
jgi:hypothetical protein